MTDPVDTDALREWAGEEPTWDDIDRGWTSEALSAIGGLCNEVDRLRSLVERQQHDDLCAVWQLNGGTNDEGCTCWKADALA